jgi:hypothetical protein
MLWLTVFILSIEVGYDYQMTPIDFEVNVSKVKVAEAFIAISLSALRMLSTVYRF